MGLKTPEVNGARQELPCLESPEVNGARQAVAAVEKYVDGAWQTIWQNIQPVNIYTTDFDGTVNVEKNDILIHFGTSTSTNKKVSIDISGMWENPIITGTLFFEAGKYNDTYYYHENITWTVYAWSTDGTKYTYDLPNADGHHAYEYSVDFELSIPIGTVTHMSINMETGIYNDTDVSVDTNLLGLKIDDVPYGA